MPFTLHTTDLSPFGQRAKLALHVKGLIKETELEDTFGGTDALGALAPMRQIPILVHKGRAIPESQVIVEYLEDLYPNPSLLPELGKDRAIARLLARIADLYIAPHLLTLIIAMRTPDEKSKILAGWEKLGRGLAYTEQYLMDDRPYAAGGFISIADIALAPFLFYVPRMREYHHLPLLASEPVKCKAYLKAIAPDPHIVKAFSEMECAFDKRVKSLKGI